MHLLPSAGLLVLCCLATPTFAGQPQDPPLGEKLFGQHGCTNCHGAGGVHPTSRYVPILRGKPADYLYEHATAIFGGSHQSSKTHFMHEQFCIGEAPDEGCYPPPDSTALRIIADWLAGDAAVPDAKKSSPGLYVTAADTYKRLTEAGNKALLIDIRSRAEVAFLGMPTIAVANIPYQLVGSFDEWDEKAQNFKLQPNSEFTLRVDELVQKRGLSKETPLYLICRSGNRSAKAANLLTLAGFRQVYTVIDGFEGDTAKDGPRKGERVVNGWKNAGLPWSYKLNKDAMYWEL